MNISEDLKVRLYCSLILSLQRVHNNLIGQYFTRFRDDHFVPNNTLSYVYPLDRYSCSDLDLNPEQVAADEIADGSVEKSCVSIIKGINKISNELESLFEEHTTGHSACNNFLEPLIAELISQTKMHVSPSSSSLYSSISALYHFHVKVNSLLWSRKRHLEHKPKINFALGQVVRHKLYDYRGVVVAWDHKPFVDVRRWDGLQNVKDPQNQPFYHIIPDEGDCMRAFGGPRSFRYVCQENLEACEASKLTVNDLNPKEWRWDEMKRVYIPSDEMRVSCSFAS